MLIIKTPPFEYYDEKSNEFVTIHEQTLHLEHSLLSLSKWESKWCKPFLTNEMKTLDETIDYIRCMTINSNVDKNVYFGLSDENIKDVNDYISAPMTATWFSKEVSRPSREIVTAEIIYYWMIALQIPFECQKWHLNRLLTLIKVCNIKNQPPKKMSKKEAINMQRDLNAKRKKEMGTKG